MPAFSETHVSYRAYTFRLTGSSLEHVEGRQHVTETQRVARWAKLGDLIQIKAAGTRQARAREIFGRC